MQSPPSSLEVSSSRTYSGLAPMVQEFLERHRIKIESACFGVAGPVQRSSVPITLPHPKDLSEAWTPLYKERARVFFAGSRWLVRLLLRPSTRNRSNCGGWP